MKLSTTRKLGIIPASAAAASLSAAILLHPAGAAFSQQSPMMNHGMPIRIRCPA